MTVETLTISIAIYGAVLSTIVFFWTWINARPKFRIVTVWGMEETLESEIEMGVCISIQNTSSHEVHLSNVQLLYPHKVVGLIERLKNTYKYRRYSPIDGWVFSALSNDNVDDGCPTSVAAGQSHQVFVPQLVLERLFSDAVRREIKVVVTDQLWERRYSKPMKIDWYDSKHGQGVA